MLHHVLKLNLQLDLIPRRVNLDTVEAMVALVLARAVLEKFGGDSLEETSAAIAAYDKYVSDRLAFDQE